MTTNDFLASLSRPDQPAKTFGVLADYLKQEVDYVLLTLLLVDGDEVQRVYSSDEVSYPLLGRKALGGTPWRRQVVENLQIFHARTLEEMKPVFADHELLRQIGCESVLNVPVVHQGRCIGSINLSHRANFYDAAAIEKVSAVAPLLAAPLLSCATEK